MTKHTLTITEKYVDEVYGRIFEGYMSENSQAFGGLMHTHCAMNSSQAIAYKVEIEKRAFEIGAQVEVVYDFLLRYSVI